VEIDIPSGEVRQRYPIEGFQFLNDVAVDGVGRVYISNTSRELHDKDIYVFQDGAYEVWKGGDELHRSNGLFVHENKLIVGSVGDGRLKAVGLDDRRVDEVTSLGAGVIDGIRVDNAGNYLVSHWRGQVYAISPEGNVVEILDTAPAGWNVADFEFVSGRNLLVIPTFLGNRVVAYELVAG
jgi:sugar lactone lactonase YvrE